MPNDSQIEALKRGFHVEERPGNFVLECKTCGSRWALDKNSKHVGNVLHLLNHEATHERPERKHEGIVGGKDRKL